MEQIIQHKTELGQHGSLYMWRTAMAASLFLSLIPPLVRVKLSWSGQYKFLDVQGWMDFLGNKEYKSPCECIDKKTKGNIKNFTCIDDGKTPKNYEERICDGPHSSLFFDTTGARKMQMN